MVTSILTGVFSGVIASLLIALAMFGIKPRLEISDEICRDKEDGLCRIKVVNRTRAGLVDVKYFLHAGFKSNDGLTDIYEVMCVKPRLEFMAPYSRKNTDYAVRISYDLNDYLTKDYNYLEFTISARHPFSGRTVVKRKIFDIQSVRCGKFQMGKIMTMLSESQTCHHSGSYMSCPKMSSCGKE